MVVYNLPPEPDATVVLEQQKAEHVAFAEEEQAPEHETRWHMPMHPGGFFNAETTSSKMGALSLADTCSSEQSRPWWESLDRSIIAAAKWFDDYDFIRRATPSEQYIIGKNGAGVRFFNYGEPMNATHLTSCKEFVACAEAKFGIATTQSAAGDIVFTRLRQPRSSETKNLGYRSSMFPGAIFLHDEFNEYEHRQVPVTHVLSHEFGHVFDPKTPDELEALKEFGESIGWDVSTMERVAPQRWQKNEIDYGALQEAISPPLATLDMRGAPTQYAQRSIHEALAETVALELQGQLGEFPWLREVLHTYLDRIGVQYSIKPPSVAELDVEHRTGAEILYPL